MLPASRIQDETSENCAAPKLLSREPWWAFPPQPGQGEMDLQWGYLEVYEDGSFRFDPTRPSLQEIQQRPGCRIHRDSE